MSVEAITWVFKHSKARLGPLLVALAIADFANDDGESWPAISTLARKSRLSERQVQYSIGILKRLGELAVDAGKGVRGTNRYVLTAISQTGLFTPQDLHPAGKSSKAGAQTTVPDSAPNPSLGTVIKRREEEPSYVMSPLSNSEALVPDWMPMAEWYEFCRMRRAMPKNVPWTPDSVKRTVTELWKLKEAGQDLSAVLAQSVQRGWRGVFEVKNGNGQTGPQTFAQIGTRRSQTAIRRVASNPPSVANDLQRALPERTNRTVGPVLPD